MIKINEDYAVESDGKGVTLFKRRITGAKSKDPGSERWDELGYFNDYAQAAIRFIDYHIAGAKNFEYMVEKLAEAKREVIDVLGGKT